jgi:hypothetical protein
MPGRFYLRIQLHLLRIHTIALDTSGCQRVASLGNADMKSESLSRFGRI